MSEQSEIDKWFKAPRNPVRYGAAVNDTPRMAAQCSLSWHDEQVAYTQYLLKAIAQLEVRERRRIDYFLPNKKLKIEFVLDQAPPFQILQVKVGEHQHHYSNNYDAAHWLRKVDLD